MSELKFDLNYTVEDLGEIEDYVYDIEVEDNHNFFANDICVHNSVYITLDELVKKVIPEGKSDQEISRILDQYCEKKLEPAIDRYYEELAEMMQASQQKMQMKRECIANKGIWTAKKRYILNVFNQEGVEYSEPKLKMSGIEAIKSSTPAVCRNAIKNALKIIMLKEESDLQEYVEKFRDEFTEFDFEQIAFPRGISDIDKWASKEGFVSGTPIHVKGSILFNRLLKEHDIGDKYEQIGSGDKIRYAQLKQPNPYFSNVVACPDNLPPEFEIERYVDYDLQFEKSFIDPLQSILKAIGWNAEKVSTLEDWFS